MGRQDAARKLRMSDSRTQVNNLEVLIRSRYPVIYIVSPEENRVAEALGGIGQRLGREIVVWSCLSGLISRGGSLGGPSGEDTADPLFALKRCRAFQGPALFIFKDFHHYLESGRPHILRLLREAAQSFGAACKTIILIGPFLKLPAELEKDITVVDFPMPGAEELGALLDKLASNATPGPNFSADLPGNVREEIIRAASGLTLIEAENVFTKSLVSNKRLGLEQIPDIIAEKRQIIRKSGLLDFYEPDVGMGDIGGLENLKRWLEKRKLAFSGRAEDFGLPLPKGVLMLGVQGCGKSLCAKAVSSLWRLPLLRLDIGRIFDSRAGGSEANMRQAIAIAEGMAPSILWVDEIDKAFGGQGGQQGDGGIARRVLGTFLGWLGEKTSPVFVAATANDLSAMPPELLRKGRFDEIFFVDLPNDNERRNILAIHLRRRGRKPENFDLAALSLAMEGFSGAEIEQAIVSALFDAFYDQGREPTGWDIMVAATETVPLSKTMYEEIDSLREWCLPRARPAAEAPRSMVKRVNQPVGSMR